MAKIYSALIFLFLSGNTYAASCCGGGQSAASVMIADHMQEWTFSNNFRADIGQTNNDGMAMMDDDDNKDHTFTSALEYKKLITSRLQGNTSINFVQKQSERLGKNESSSGLGDFAVGAFYEALTNYSYIPLQPRIFSGLKFIIPFGENSFNSKKELRTDIRGTGFYKIDLPVVAVIGAWKFSISPQYLPKQKSLSSTNAFATAASYTYSLTDEIDISATTQWSYLAKKRYEEKNLIAGQYWELSLSPSWMITKTNSLNLNYSDSTILGKSRNSALYRSVSLGMTWSDLL
jgi:hypothetical protein